MKRLALVLLAGFYLFIVIGVTVGGHFCMGHLQKVTVFAKADGKNCCCENNSGCTCCESKHVQLTDADDHGYSATPSIACQCSLLPHLLVKAETLSAGSSVLAVFAVDPPPDISKPPVHLLNNVFRI